MEKNAVNYDLFISYRHSVEDDLNAVREIAIQLRQKRLKVFVDESGIKYFDSITQTIEQALTNSKALLVYLTKDYFSSKACICELNSAFIATINEGKGPRERIFIINASDTTESLDQLPVELRDAKYAFSVQSVIAEIPDRINKIEGTFNEITLLSSLKSYGRELTSSPRFVGRIKEMWDLHSKLNSSGCTMITGQTASDVAQVSGMGGIGKTLLAEEYALRIGAAYPGGVFWLEAHGSFNHDAPDIEIFKAACNEQFVKILNALGESPAPDTPFEILKSSVARIIEEGGQRCLWIVDDLPYGLADHISTVKNWFSPHQLACTLVTTRSREYLSIGNEVPIDVLDQATSLELLEKHGIDTKSQKTAAIELIELLGSHSMALDIAGAVIAESNDTITGYLGELKEGMDEILDVPKELVGSLPAGHDRSIVRTMQHSISRLGNKSLDFLILAANLSPAPIPINLIEAVFGKVDELDGKESRKRTRRSVQGCKQLSLAKQTGQSWQVHALISATVKYLGQASDERAIQFKTEAIKVLSDVIAHDLNHKAAESISLEVEHARFLTSIIEGKEELVLLRRLVMFNIYRGHYKLIVEDWQRILDFYTKLLGSNHPDTLTSMNNLAVALTKIGDLRGAKELQEQILKDTEELLGPNHLDTLTSMNNLANTLHSMGHYRKAEKLLKQVFERMENIPEMKHLDNLTNKSNFPHNLSETGDYPGAKKSQIQDFALRKKLLNINDQVTQTSKSNLGTILYDRGDYPGAKELQLQVFERRKETLGLDHPDTLTIMSNLVLTLSKMGDYPGAKELEEQILERRKKILGPDHPSTLNSMNNLAATLWKIEDYPGAKELQTQVLKCTKKSLGLKHQNTLISMSNLASILSKMEDHHGAKELEEQVLELRKGTLGSDHPDTLSIMSNLATTLSKMGDYPGAKKLEEQVLERRKKILGPDHPSTLNSMNNLAVTLWNIGDYPGAKELEEQVLERRKKILGPDHPDTRESMKNLATTLQKMGDRHGAFKVMKKLFS